MTKPTNTLGGYLRQHTADIHRQAETVLSKLGLFTSISLKNYAVLIQIQFLWHQAIEAVLTSANPSLQFDDFIYTQKTYLLKKDLDAMDIEPDIPITANLEEPAIPGIIYVLNGSMLGGALISKHLAKAGIEEHYRNYFTYCAEEGKVVWPRTQKYLQMQEPVGNVFNSNLKSSVHSFELMIHIAEIEIAKSRRLEKI